MTPSFTTAQPQTCVDMRLVTGGVTMGWLLRHVTGAPMVRWPRKFQIMI